MNKDILELTNVLQAFFVVCGIFGFGKQQESNDNQALDKETIRRRLTLGLEDLSDADRRSTGFSSVNQDELSIEQAELAEKILRKIK